MIYTLTNDQIHKFYEDVKNADSLTTIKYLHDTGLAYKLQGWFGRTVRDLIEQGIIKE